METVRTATIVAMAAMMMGCSQQKDPQGGSQPLTDQEVIEKGKYLVNLGGCNDCHTPKVFSEHGMALDETRILSGHPEGAALPEIDPRALQPGYWTLFNEHLTTAVGPWGLSMARNLTPHETGLKGWTVEVFINAMRTGKHMGVEQGRPIMPPMPWENLKQVSDDDLTAMFRYLQSLKPVKNFVPEPISVDNVIAKKS